MHVSWKILDVRDIQMFDLCLYYSDWLALCYFSVFLSRILWHWLIEVELDLTLI
jgi:hypothetical protein